MTAGDVRGRAHAATADAIRRRQLGSRVRHQLRHRRSAGDGDQRGDRRGGRPPTTGRRSRSSPVDTAPGHDLRRRRPPARCPGLDRRDVPPQGSGGPATEASMGLCASYAAGAICCCASGAHVLRPEIRRGLFTVDAGATGLETWAGDYPVFPTTLNENQGLALSLSSALQRQLDRARADRRGQRPQPHRRARHARRQRAAGGRRAGPRPRAPAAGARLHQVPPDRLPGAAAARDGRRPLGPSERTPVFLIGGSWDRFSWYLRLPGPPSHPWSGIARLECAANVTAAEVIALARPVPGRAPPLRLGGVQGPAGAAEPLPGGRSGEGAPSPARSPGSGVSGAAAGGAHADRERDVVGTTGAQPPPLGVSGRAPD